MFVRSISTLAGAAILFGASAVMMSAPAHALTMKECSAKYKSAQDAGTLQGMKWNDFRKAQCGTDADANAAAPEEPAAKPSKKKAQTAAAAPAADAKGLSMKECSAKYQAAQDADSLDGMKWNDFRKNECGPGADPVALSFDGNKEPAAPTNIKAPRGVSFPRAVSSKFSDEKPAKARMHTCLEQYYTNKENDSLGGLKWIQKGGGYYSLCNAKLKADS